MKTKVAASLTIRGIDNMAASKVRSAANWVRRQAKALAANKELGASFDIPWKGRIVVKHQAKMTPRGRRDIAKWLERQAGFLVEHHKQLAPIFRARYFYAKSAT